MEADPVLDPLLERLAFLETANNGLRVGGYSAEIHQAALLKQLEEAQKELSRQQETLAAFYPAMSALEAARDRAQASAEENRKACEKTTADRDALRHCLVAAEADLDLARRKAQENENALRVARLKEETEAAERLQALKAWFAEREALLLKSADESVRLREAALLELETVRREAQLQLQSARRDAQAAEDAARESQRKAVAETEARLTPVAAEFAEREAHLLQASETDRRRLEAAERTLKESLLEAQAKAEMDFEALTKKFVEREVAHARTTEDERRRLAERAVALENEVRAEADRERKLTLGFAERETQLAKAAEDARKLQASAELRLEATRRISEATEASLRQKLLVAQAETAERLETLTNTVAARETLHLKTVENDRIRLSELTVAIERESRRVESEQRLHDATKLKLEAARRSARTANRAFHQAQKTSLPQARAEAAANAARQLENAENTLTLIQALERDLRKSLKEEERLKTLLEETMMALAAAQAAARRPEDE